MNKQRYTAPEILVIKFDTFHVICSSNDEKEEFDCIGEDYKWGN